MDRSKKDAEGQFACKCLRRCPAWERKQWNIKEIRRRGVLPKTYTEVYCEVKVTYGKAWTGEILVGLLVGGAKLQLKASSQGCANNTDIFPKRAIAYSLSAVSSTQIYKPHYSFYYLYCLDYHTSIYKH